MSAKIFQDDEHEKFGELLNEYFEEQKKPSIAGLCRHLGIYSKETFYKYKKKEGFKDHINKASIWIEELHNKKLYESNCTGSIFVLKANYGYSEKSEIDITTNNESLNLGATSTEELVKRAEALKKLDEGENKS